MKTNRRKWSREDLRFIEANAGNMSPKEMAEKLNVSQKKLQNYANRHGVSLRMAPASKHDAWL
ncbi:TPA: hypothetical protein JGA48_004754, partial [Salmonella enterica]|nr:hypothetical protein [Salmonella enterica]